MDNKTKYAIALVIGILVVIVAVYANSVANKTKMSDPSQASVQSSDAEYVIEGFPLDNHITFFGPNNTLKDLGYLANDAGRSEWDVWSAARILSELKKVTPYNVDDSASPSPSTMWSSDKISAAIAAAAGSAGASTQLINDAMSSPTSVWSSSKISSAITAAGSAIINDAAPSPSTVWSSDKVSSAIAAGASALIGDSFTSPTLTWSSQNIASQIKNVVDDTKTSPTQTWSSQQITTALDAAGAKVVNDSAVAPTTTWSSSKLDAALKAVPAVDDATASSTSTWSSQQITTALATASSKVVNDAAVGPSTTWSSAKLDAALKAVPAVDDATTSATGTWSSQKVSSMLSSTMPMASPATAGDLAVLTATGAVADSGFRVDDAAPAAADVLWSSMAIKSGLASKLSSVPGTTANQLAFFDGTGGLAASTTGVVMSDTAPAGAGVIWSSAKTTAALDGKQNLVPGAKAGAVAFFDAAGQVVDKGLVFDDAAPASASVVWSSQMTSGALSKNQKLVPAAAANNVATFDAAGQTQDSGLKMDDSAAASQSVLWSSAKILAATGSQQLVPTAAAGNLASFDAAGRVIDAGLALNDAAVAGASVLWSSAAIDAKMAKKQNLVPLAAKGNFAAFDAAGQVVDGGVALNDAAPAGPNVVWSSQKLAASQQPLVVPSAAGNLASLSASGQVTDSTFSVSDASPPGPNVLWSSQKMSAYQKLGATPPAGTFLIYDSSGQSIESGSKIDDSAAPSAKILWSSQKTAGAFQTKVTPSVAGNIAALDGAGQTTDSGYTLNDAAGPSATVLWSSAKLATSKQNFIAGPAAGGLVSTDAVGQTVMSPYKVDDAAPAGSTVLWSSAKLASATPTGTAKNVTVIGPTGSGVADSGMKIDDTASAGPNVLWSSAKMSSLGAGAASIADGSVSATTAWSSQQTTSAISAASAAKMNLVPTAPAQSIARFATGGQVESSGFVIDDKALAASALWSSLKVDQTFQKIVAGTAAGDFATFTAAGQVMDSGLRFDNAVSSDATLWSSKKISDNFVGRINAKVDSGKYLVYEGIRFGIAPPTGTSTQGLTLQFDDATTINQGVWAYSSAIQYPSTPLTKAIQVWLPNTTAAPLICCPGWTLIPSSFTDSVIRLDRGQCYRVLVFIAGSFLKNDIFIQKLA